MFEPGEKIKHTRSGLVVEFQRELGTRRGVTKIATSGPWGPLDVRAFESVEPEPKPKKKAAKKDKE
jgi:hypothetical protein